MPYTDADLTTTELLEHLLKKTPGSLANDEYALLIITAASEVVRNAAEHPEWVRVNPIPDSGQVIAPLRAQHIALWLASRAHEDKGNLQRRTAGPISHTYFENGIGGLDLKPSELKDLQGLRVGKTGLWTQPVGAGRHSGGVYIPGTLPNELPFHIDDGSMGFAYGVGG